MRVVIAEDSALLREGLSATLPRFGVEVVAAVGDSPGLLAAVAHHRPQLVITDVRMPPDYSDEGLRAAVELRTGQPGLAVVVLSQYVQHSYAGKLLGSGSGRSVGYLLKDRIGDVAEFAGQLRRVAGGGTVVDPEVVRQLMQHHRDPLKQLSTRERDVLALVAQGHSNAAAARLLRLTEAGVAKHIGNLFAKLNLPVSDDTNRRVLAVLAYLRSRSD
ncbi:response regulator transcription factor [Actinoplanes sp. N902-109]|uniref:response regulator transcription factor n=1 Tax=Actinoplanes sp. (strain N902-109) TaxID=649831 RepID=UPI0003294EFD|nr:response regulator transcription factor [Actinoplanes sp. N902-109]AGL16357.1 LuxR family two component transcriptional regulator [Actinoplanes sp. N902-109]